MLEFLLSGGTGSGRAMTTRKILGALRSRGFDLDAEWLEKVWLVDALAAGVFPGLRSDRQGGGFYLAATRIDALEAVLALQERIDLARVHMEGIFACARKAAWDISPLAHTDVWYPPPDCSGGDGEDVVDVEIVSVR